MKSLTLCVLPLLLLASAAWAGDDDIEKLQAHRNQLLADLEAAQVQATLAKDPKQKEAHLAQVDALQQRLQQLHEAIHKLQAEQAERQQTKAALHEQAKELFKRLWEDERKLEEPYAELLLKKDELERAGEGAEKMAALRERIQRVEEPFMMLQALRGAVDDVHRLVEKGEFEKARTHFENIRNEYDGLKTKHEGHEYVAALEALRTADPGPRTEAARRVAEALALGDRRAPRRDPAAGAFFLGLDRERIEHLEKAAKHLHEAGMHEQAVALEAEVKRMQQAQAARAAVLTALALQAGKARGTDDGGVIEAVQALRLEVRQLREEVREIKRLLLEERRAR